MVFFGDHRPCQRRYLSLELHRQCILPALAVVGGVDGVNIPPPARELCGVIPADTVELHGMDAAQRTDKPLRAVLPMIQLHKVHHAPQDSRPEGIRSALPRFHDVPQGFAVDLFAQLVDLAGIDQLAAVDDRKLVRRVDTNESSVVVAYGITLMWRSV